MYGKSERAIKLPKVHKESMNIIESLSKNEIHILGEFNLSCNDAGEKESHCRVVTPQ